jgi:hypothetical protein
MTRIKEDTVAHKWAPANNCNSKYGRCGFAELPSAHNFGSDLDPAIDRTLKGEKS